MNRELKGSNLASAMLERGDEKVWCAVSNDSDEHAMTKINNADYICLKHISLLIIIIFFAKTKRHGNMLCPLKKLRSLNRTRGFN